MTTISARFSFWTNTMTNPSIAATCSMQLSVALSLSLSACSNQDDKKVASQ